MNTDTGTKQVPTSVSLNMGSFTKTLKLNTSDPGLNVKAKSASHRGDGVALAEEVFFLLF
jgi:hypothetical protein